MDPNGVAVFAYSFAARATALFVILQAGTPTPGVGVDELVDYWPILVRAGWFVAGFLVDVLVAIDAIEEDAGRPQTATEFVPGVVPFEGLHSGHIEGDIGTTSPVPFDSTTGRPTPWTAAVHHYRS